MSTGRSHAVLKMASKFIRARLTQPLKQSPLAFIRALFKAVHMWVLVKNTDPRTASRSLKPCDSRCALTCNALASSALKPARPWKIHSILRPKMTQPHSSCFLAGCVSNPEIQLKP